MNLNQIGFIMPYSQARLQRSLVFPSSCPFSVPFTGPLPHPSPSYLTRLLLSHLYSESQTGHQPPSLSPTSTSTRTATVTVARPPARLSNIPLIPRKITSSRTILARPLFLHRGHLGTTWTGGAGREREQRGPLEMMVTVLLAWHSRSRESLRENGARAEGDPVLWPGLPKCPSPFLVLLSHQHQT